VKKTAVLLFMSILSLFCDDEFTVKRGEYTFTTEFENNTTVTVFYAVPMKFNRIMSSASNIVFCAPFVGERKFFVREFNNYFVKNMGCTVFTFEYKYKKEEPENRTKWYYYKESGWHDLMFKVQDKLIADYGLDRKKLIIVGESGGASMAQQMGIYYPDKVDAVAVVGGANYDKPTVKTDVAWLMINTWGDDTKKANDKFMEDSTALNMQVLRPVTPPIYANMGAQDFHHGASKMAEEYLFEFVKGIIDLRKNNNKLPSAEKWPVKYSFEGKILNFPSEGFRKKWEELPHDFIKKTFYPSAKDDVMEYPVKKNGNIILFLHDKKFTSTNLMDNIYYLQELGYNVVTIDISMDDYVICKERIIKALDYSRNKAKQENKKLYAVGFGESGLTLLNETAKIKENGVKKLFVFNPVRNYYSEKTVNFPADCECKVYYTQDYWDDKPVTGKAWCNEEVLPLYDDFGRKWFKLLDAMFIEKVEDERIEVKKEMKEKKVDEKKEEIVIGDKDRILSTSQVDEIDRNLTTIERFLMKKETEIAKKMFEKLTAKYSDGNIAYVNAGTYKWIIKKMEDIK